VPLYRRAKAAGVRLNVCPTSNVKLGRVARIEDHPIRALFDAGVMTAAELDAVRLEALGGPL
jgi:adenosine deaminase